MVAPFLASPRPIVAAPMAGASTPELVAAVSAAGGSGFLAAGYLSAAKMAGEIAALRRLTAAPVAVNLFVPQRDRTTELAAGLVAYGDELAETADRYRTGPGEPRFDEDDFTAKVDRLVAGPVYAVSFTFGAAPAGVVERLRGVGTEVGFTVTGADEAQQAASLGATFLVAQGAGAGGHRGTWDVAEEPNGDDTVAVIRAVVGCGLPVIAAGGVDGPESVQRLLDAGATAVAAGTLFVATDESRSQGLHKDALTSGAFTEAVVTRAFSGRWARALVNDFVRRHDGHAPAAYPNVHHLTRPIRTAAATAGDPDGMALWAGTGHRAAVRRLAAEVVAFLAP